MKRLHGELLAVVLLLAVTLFISSYYDFAAEARAISQSEGLPSWATWAGAPWDVTNLGDTLLSASLSDNKVRIAAKGHWIWRTGYVWNPAKINAKGTEGDWQSFEFPQTSQYEGWAQDAAVTYLPLKAGEVLDGDNYVLAYTCNWKNGRWYCGCRTEDDCGHWQLQTFTASGMTDAVREDMSKYLTNPSSVPNFDEIAQSIVAATDEMAADTRADFDNDGTIDFDDFFAFAAAFRSQSYDTKFDLDGSGKVDFQDFFRFADEFGKRTSSAVRYKIASTQTTASIKIIADDEYTLYVNGNAVGSGTEKSQTGSYDVALKSGENVVGILAKDRGGEEGVLFEMTYGDEFIISNKTWKAKLLGSMGSEEREKWNIPDTGFDDSSWETTGEKSAKRRLDFPHAKWMWGKVTGASRFRNDQYAFRKSFYLLTDEETAKAAGCIEQGSMEQCNRLHPALKSAVAEQIAISRGDPSLCDNVLCRQKAAFFSCTGKGKSQGQCLSESISQSGIPQNPSFQNFKKLDFDIEHEPPLMTGEVVKEIRVSLVETKKTYNNCIVHFYRSVQKSDGFSDEKEMDYWYNPGAIIKKEGGSFYQQSTESSSGTDSCSGWCDMISSAPLPVKFDDLTLFSYDEGASSLFDSESLKKNEMKLRKDMLCASDFRWHVCDRDGIKTFSNGKSYICDGATGTWEEIR